MKYIGRMPNDCMMICFIDKPKFKKGKNVWFMDSKKNLSFGKIVISGQILRMYHSANYGIRYKVKAFDTNETEIVPEQYISRNKNRIKEIIRGNK